MKLVEKFVIALVAVGLGAANALYSQEGRLSLRDFAVRYAQLRSQMHQLGAEKIMKELFDPSMTGSRAQYDINNQLRVVPLNYKILLENYLSELESGIITQVELIQLLHESVKENIGLLAAVNQQTRLKDNQVLEKETVVYTMLVILDEQQKWKIYNYTATYITEERNKGICTCELYTSHNGNIVARLIYPEGESMATALDYFVFSNNNRTVTVKDLNYEWQNGIVNSFDKKQQLGVAKTPQEVVIEILLKALYKDYCTEIKLK
ncbi:MAG: hypothetical protein RMJ44_10705 [Cytophagales bacterium]|nr:hypothetical protein [Bernardetiaceae bacterium]MDW8211544.1 hypothetical protein [Cytophagales bacterium]